MLETQKANVIIALRNGKISSEIVDIFRLHFSDTTLIAQASSFDEVQNGLFALDSRNDCIILFDDSMILECNLFHHLECIEIPLHYIYIAQAPDFSRLQMAVRCGAEDCLLYPISVQELEDTLARIQNRNFIKGQIVLPETNEASRYLFWRNDVRLITSTKMTIAQANKKYGTHFSGGLFRAIFIELSAPGREESIIDNEELQDQVIRSSSSILYAQCFDIIYNRHPNGVSALLNFSVEKRGHIDRLIDQLFFGLKRELTSSHIDVTMSIGRIYSDFAKLSEAKQELLDIRWARRKIGSGRIINAEDLNEKELSPEQHHELGESRLLIIHYFELLDRVRAEQYINQFFDKFIQILPVREIRTFTAFLLDYLFQTYPSELESYGNLENLRHGYIARTSTTSSHEELRKVTTENLLDLMEKIELVNRRQYSRPVRDCIAMIAGNHCENIRLEDLARMTQLSPQYLSSLFHKETGETLTSYIKAQKLKLAQKMLSESAKNITEIALTLGFSHVHYFSKFFKKSIQMTPSEYRRLKHN